MRRTLDWETSLRVESVEVVAELLVGVATKGKCVSTGAYIYSKWE